MSARRGFALPIIIIVILLPILLLAAWSPWVTNGFALNKLKTYSPCPQLAVVPDFKTPSSSQKVFFGRKLIKTESACGTYDIFISALGTIHQVKFYKIDTDGTYPSNQKSPDKTANPDSIGSNWKTYTSKINGYSFKYPNDFIDLENNPENGNPKFINSNTLNLHNLQESIAGKYIQITADYKIPDEKFKELDNLKEVKSGFGLGTSTAENKYKDITVAGKSAIIGIEKNNVAGNEQYYWTTASVIIQVNKRDSLWFEFQFRNQPNDQELVDKVVSTVKFTN